MSLCQKGADAALSSPLRFMTGGCYFDTLELLKTEKENNQMREEFHAVVHESIFDIRHWLIDVQATKSAHYCAPYYCYFHFCYFGPFMLKDEIP